MGHTIKISLQKDILTAESSDVLKNKSNDATIKAFVKIQPYNIRTSINLEPVNLSVEKKTAALRAAQKEAELIEKELEDRIDQLVCDGDKSLKKLQAKDKLGDAKAGEEAEKEVKKCSDDIDDSLPDFGRRIRKVVEKATVKLPPGAKSMSSGQFRGIKLVAKFEHAGASADIVKDYQDAAKSLEKAKQMIAEDAKADKKSTDAIKASVLKTYNEVSAVNRTNNVNESKKVTGEISATAESFAKSLDMYQKQTEEFEKLLKKTLEGLTKESTELQKDLSNAKMQDKKKKLDLVGKELKDLQDVASKRVKESEKLAEQFRKAEKITSIKEWETQLKSLKDQVATFEALDPEKFNKALQNMVTEGKKTTPG